MSGLIMLEVWGLNKFLGKIRKAVFYAKFLYA